MSMTPVLLIAELPPAERIPDYLANLISTHGACTLLLRPHLSEVIRSVYRCEPEELLPGLTQITPPVEQLALTRACQTLDAFGLTAEVLEFQHPSWQTVWPLADTLRHFFTVWHLAAIYQCQVTMITPMPQYNVARALVNRGHQIIGSNKAQAIFSWIAANTAKPEGRLSFPYVSSLYPRVEEIRSLPLCQNLQKVRDASTQERESSKTGDLFAQEASLLSELDHYLRHEWGRLQVQLTQGTHSNGGEVMVTRDKIFEDFKEGESAAAALDGLRLPVFAIEPASVEPDNAARFLRVSEKLLDWNYAEGLYLEEILGIEKG